MRSYLEEIHDLFEAYYELINSGHEAPSLYWNICRLVLTGEQILESGIADPSEFQDNKKYTDEEYEDLEKEKDKLEEKYNELIVKSKALQDIKLTKIEKILQGKEGPFIDELRDVLK